MRIVRQILDRMPTGDYRIQDKKITPPPRARIDESMEALIHHFKIFTEGFKVPEGEVYVAVESPRGEIGCYIVSRRLGDAVPDAHPRAVVRQHPVPAAHDARRAHRRRGRDHLLASTPSSARSTVDNPRERMIVARLNDANVLVAKEIIGRFPRPKSALIPLLHLAQEQDGYVTDDAMAHIAELRRRHAGRGVRHGLVLRDVQVRDGRSVLHQHLHEHLLPAARRVGAARSTPRSASASSAGGTTDDGLFTLEDVECIAACTEAPALQVNYRYRYTVTNDDFDQLVDDLRCRPARRRDPAPRHARPRPPAHDRPLGRHRRRSASQGRRDGDARR